MEEIHLEDRKFWGLNLSLWRDLAFSVIAVIFALLVGSVFMLITKGNPILAYGALWNSAFGSLKNFGETLVNTTPLIFTGLSVAFAFRCGLFNIGGEGQFLIGYVATAWAGYYFSGLPPVIHLPLTLLIAILAGGLWAGIAGYLKARLGVHEVITTIMLNYTSLYLTTWLVGTVLMAEGFIPATPEIADGIKLYRFLPPSRANLGVFIALLCAFLIYYLLWKTHVGYEIRAVGLNPNAAEYGGISAARNMVLAMFISGALAGLAGAVQVLGLEHKAYQPFGFFNYGFTGIAVALLGNNHPGGVILAALLFGVLSRGAMQMQSVADVPKEIVTIIQAIIIFFVAANYLFKKLWLKMQQERGVKEDAR